MGKFLIVLLVGTMMASCMKNAEKPSSPKELTVTNEIGELSEMPEYNAPSSSGGIEPVAEGDPAPFDGICITEENSIKVSELRIDYDEVYQLYSTDRKLMMFVIQVQERQLHKADEMIDKKNDEIYRLRSSWWQRNKLAIGIGTGVIIGAVMMGTGGYVWSRMDD